MPQESVICRHQRLHAPTQALHQRAPSPSLLRPPSMPQPKYRARTRRSRAALATADRHPPRPPATSPPRRLCPRSTSRGRPAPVQRCPAVHRPSRTSARAAADKDVGDPRQESASCDAFRVDAHRPGTAPQHAASLASARAPRSPFPALGRTRPPPRASRAHSSAMRAQVNAHTSLGSYDLRS